MPSKSKTRKQTHPAMSPLLRALTFSRAAHEPVTQAMLLQAYASLDAFRRGHGSRESFGVLGRQLLVATELSRLGYQTGSVADIEEAHASLMQMDAAEKANGTWQISDTDYGWLCVALNVFDRQLDAASLDDIARAEARMVEGLLRVDYQAATNPDTDAPRELLPNSTVTDFIARLQNAAREERTTTLA